MIEWLVDAAFALLLVVGLPALFVLFVLKGALVGKPLPTTVLLPGYVLAISASELETVGIVLVSSSGYVGGQLLVYFGARGKGLSFVRSAPRVQVSDERVRRSEELFERYGGAGIFLTNFVPYLRGLILIPAGMASYPVGRVLLYAFSSTLIYHGAIVAVAVGAVRMLL
jgi:membrane protein DedA with SNARE-associated domain